MAEPDILNVQVTETDVTNTTSETDLFTYTVPGNTLGTNKALRVQIKADYLNNSGVNATVRFRVYYGATEMYQDLGATMTTDASRHPVLIELWLIPRNATNSQALGGYILQGVAGGATTGIGDLGNDEILSDSPLRGNDASEDSTASKVLKVTVAHSAASTNLSIRKTYSVVELLAP